MVLMQAKFLHIWSPSLSNLIHEELSRSTYMGDGGGLTVGMVPLRQIGQGFDPESDAKVQGTVYTLYYKLSDSTKLIAVRHVFELLNWK